jgi:hypothetical protein
MFAYANAFWLNPGPITPRVRRRTLQRDYLGQPCRDLALAVDGIAGDALNASFLMELRSVKRERHRNQAKGSTLGEAR